MPPRYVYWTILIDNKPTAFRAREKEDLLPTLAQLRRSNADVVMKWFARGRIWDSPESEREAQRRPRAGVEKRGRDWRPGGTHKDPRDRFKKKKEVERQTFGPGEPRRWRDKPRGTDRPATASRDDRPWGKPPAARARGDRPWGHKPGGGARGPQPSESGWRSKPHDVRRPFRGGQPAPKKREDEK